jgi:hypothetical protein
MTWRSLWDQLTRRARYERMVDEFETKFPARCMICSLQRYGFTHGHTASPLPERHWCIERNSYFGGER